MVDVRTHQRVLAGSPGMLSPEHGTPSRHITHNGSRIAPSRAVSTSSSSEDTKDFLHYHRADETKEEEPQQDQTWCVHCTRNIRWMNWLSHVNSHGHQVCELRAVHTCVRVRVWGMPSKQGSVWIVTITSNSSISTSCTQRNKCPPVLRFVTPSIVETNIQPTNQPTNTSYFTPPFFSSIFL